MVASTPGAATPGCSSREAGFRADTLTAWPPWPLRRCEGSLWGGAESGVELDWPLQSPSLKGTGLASPFVWKHRHPASRPRTPGRRAAAFLCTAENWKLSNRLRGPSARSPVGDGFPGALSSVSVYAWTAGPTTL